jgi:hypothetical protein
MENFNEDVPLEMIPPEASCSERRCIGYGELQWGGSVAPCHVLYFLGEGRVEVNYQRGGSSNRSKDVDRCPDRVLFLPHTTSFSV